MTNSLFFKQGPDQWPEIPKYFSYSSLNMLKDCRLRWQLENGRYGESKKFPQRPQPATIEGTLVHEALDRLFKAAALAQSPPIGSSEFFEITETLNLKDGFKAEIDRYTQEVMAHPRGAGFRFQSSPQILMNRVIQLFRQQYRPKYSMPSLSFMGPEMNAPSSEEKIFDPDLGFMGIIDLVRYGPQGPVIVDFKTGKVHDEHFNQLKYYALLWWRNRSELPRQIEVCYPHETKSQVISETELRQTENDLKQRLQILRVEMEQTPAPANPGQHCHYCQVKQFCHRYWETHQAFKFEKKNAGKIFSDQVTISSSPGVYGFEIKTSAQESIPVVFSQDGTALHGPFAEGETLRVLNAKIDDEGNALEFKSWSEVYHVSDL